MLLATVPLVLSPVFRLIYNHIYTHIRAIDADGGLGFGLSNTFHYAFIVLVCIFGAFLFFRLQNGTIVLNPIKFFPQWDGAANNIIRVLGCIEIFFSVCIIRGTCLAFSLSSAIYRMQLWPYELLWGIFGLIGAILYVLVFCSVEPK